MSDVNRNKLRALATGCRDEVIRSHGWEGTIEEAELIARDRRLLMELSPEVVIQLLDDYDDLLAENATLRADRDAFGQNAMDLKARAERAETERDQLRAELAAIRGQEPVAWGVPNTRITESQPFVELLHSTEGCQYPEMLVPLYALPPQQPDAVSVPGVHGFAVEILRGALEGGSFDGGDIQEMGVKYGLLFPEQRTEPCCESGCNCAEFGFPAECFRIARALLSTSQAEEGQPCDK